MPQIDTTIPVSMSGVSAGQTVNFAGEVVSSLVITNNSGFSVQYSTGGAWITVANGASASIGGVDPASFRIRKAALDASPGYPLQVGMSWVYADDEVRAAGQPGGGMQFYVGGDAVDAGALTAEQSAVIDAEIAEIALGKKLVRAKTTANHYVFGAYATMLDEMRKLCVGFGSSAKDTVVGGGITITSTLYYHPTSGLDANDGLTHLTPKQNVPDYIPAGRKVLVAAGSVFGAGEVNAMIQSEGCVISRYDANPASPNYGQEIGITVDPFTRALNGGWITAAEEAKYFTIDLATPEGSATASRGIYFNHAAGTATCVLRGAIIKNATHAAARVGLGILRLEDCYILDCKRTPSSSNGYDGGCGLRADAAGTILAVRCFFERIGTDIAWLYNGGGHAITDSAIKHTCDRQVYGVQHADVLQFSADPGAFKMLRCVISHMVQNSVLLNSGNGETTAAGAVIMSTGTSGSYASEGVLEDVIYVTNRQGTYFQHKPGVTMRRVIGLLVGDSSLSQASLITWERTGNVEDGCVWGMYDTGAQVLRTVLATGAVTKATTIDLGRLDA